MDVDVGILEFMIRIRFLRQFSLEAKHLDCQKVKNANFMYKINVSSANALQRL
jgi:hypothetical protein